MGDIGFRGMQGFPGPNGFKGVQGQVGLRGLDGFNGIQGLKGISGDSGFIGMYFNTLFSFILIMLSGQVEVAYLGLWETLAVKARKEELAKRNLLSDISSQNTVRQCKILFVRKTPHSCGRDTRYCTLWATKGK